jgi:hypothetical protein
MRWLSGDTLGAYVNSYHRISVWDKINSDGQHATALANCYLDPAVDVELMLKTSGDTIKFIDMSNNETTIASSGRDGEYSRFILPIMQAWQVYLILDKE